MDKSQIHPLPASAAQWLIKVLVEDGMSVADLLKQTGLDGDWCNQPDATLNPNQYERLVGNALATSADPALGFSVSRQMNFLSRNGFWGYAVMSCATLGEALETSIRYWPLTGSLLQIHAHAVDGVIHVEVAPALDFVRDDIWRFAVEKFLSSTHVSLGSMVGRTLPFRSIDLSYAAPPHAARYEELFACSVRFGSDHDLVTMDSDALSWPLVTSQPQLADLCRERCANAMLKVRGNDGFVASIQEIVWANISRVPSLDGVAAQLGMAPRTLRRRLHERGSSFQRILDSVREAVARDYLINTDLSIDQIATLVGFSEPTTFRSTFKRWTGQSAADVRRARK